jgi:hypothetical protein
MVIRQGTNDKVGSICVSGDGANMHAHMHTCTHAYKQTSSNADRGRPASLLHACIVVHTCTQCLNAVTALFSSTTIIVVVNNNNQSSLPCSNDLPDLVDHNVHRVMVLVLLTSRHTLHLCARLPQREQQKEERYSNASIRKHHHCRCCPCRCSCYRSCFCSQSNKDEDGQNGDGNQQHL